MARLTAYLMAAVVAIVLARFLAPMFLLVAAVLLLLAWKRPGALDAVLASPLAHRLPSFARSTPMRFASAVGGSAVVAVLVASAIGSPAQVAGEDVALASPSPSPRLATSTPRPTATPQATATALATPQATPVPTATPAPTPAFGLEPTGPTEMATVASVTDGDTIRVLLNGQNVPVRYIGIDTPETQDGVEWMGREASDANARLVAGQTVYLERDVSHTDQYGRLLRYVWLDTDAGWLLVNLELLRLGVAQVTTYPPDVKYVDALYLPAQAQARANGIGLWGAPPATPAPIAPLVPGSNCEPSYPDICIPIGRADIDCPDIDARRFTVLWNVPNPDPHRFDGDADGVGCES